MNKNDIPKNIPDSPGVYYFTKGNEILYIGKATSLKNRIRSYFTDDIIDKRGPKIKTMITEANAILWKETPSVLEALILESHEIKKNQPLYNTREKDNKSYYYVVITKEEFPRIFTVRHRDLLKNKSMPFDIDISYGPYPHGNTLRQALRIIRKIFPFRDKKSKDVAHSAFYQSLGLTPDITDAKKQKEYEQTINHIKLIFEGKMQSLITQLEQDMYTAAENLEFEKASSVKRKIFALQHIQDISLIKDEPEKIHTSTDIRIEGYDVAHLQGDNPIGVMTVIVNGEIDNASYRLFHIKNGHKGSDTHALEEILIRRLQHPEWGIPHYIVVDGGVAQKRTAERVLRDYDHGSIPVISVVKDERHKPKEIRGQAKIIEKYRREILLVNAEAHRFSLKHHRNQRKKRLA